MCPFFLFVRVPGPDLAFSFLPGLLPVWYFIAHHRPCQSREERMKILIKRDGWIMWLYVNFACQEPSIIIDRWLVLCFQISISAKPVCVTTSGWLGEGAGAPGQGGLIPSLPPFLIPRANLDGFFSVVIPCKGKSDLQNVLLSSFPLILFNLFLGHVAWQVKANKWT